MTTNESRSLQVTERDPCTCGHMIKSHKIVGKIPRKALPKFRCRFCDCNTLELA